MRLIDADKLEETLQELEDGENECWTPAEFKEYLLDYQPTVDAEPVVHAHWIQKIEPSGYVKTVCSKCGTEVALSYGKTCHNVYCDVCGAKMIEEATAHES